MSRLREGRANTARGAAHFLRETVGRVRYGGGQGTTHGGADSGFYAHTVVAACREMGCGRGGYVPAPPPPGPRPPAPPWPPVSSATGSPGMPVPRATHPHVCLCRTGDPRHRPPPRPAATPPPPTDLPPPSSPPIAHRLVLGCVGPHLGPVQRHVPQLHQSCLLAKLQHRLCPR